MEEYTAPALELVGDVAELTLGAHTGSHLDSDFTRGTPVTDLTFS